MKLTIGILGGIGAESSARFYTDLIKKYKEYFQPKDNTDFPRIIINSIPAQELISGDNKSKLQEYVEGLKFLEKESDIICIICNTAYNYYDFFAEKISKPIIDLRALIKNSLLEKDIKTITILGTPTSYRENLYVFENFNYIKPTDEEIKNLEKIIFNINTGGETEDEISTIKNLFDKYQGISDAVIIGCTEVSLVLDTVQNIKKVDPINLLIDFLLKEYGK